jgi:hypothetical protein
MAPADFQSRKRIAKVQADSKKERKHRLGDTVLLLSRDEVAVRLVKLERTVDELGKASKPK